MYRADYTEAVNIFLDDYHRRLPRSVAEGEMFYAEAEQFALGHGLDVPDFIDTMNDVIADMAW